MQKKIDERPFKASTIKQWAIQSPFWIGTIAHAALT